VCATLRTDAECGLAVGNAAGWFAACGPNVLAATPPVPNCRRILAQFESPLALLHVATAKHTAQSRADSPTVPKPRCSAGMYSTANWSASPVASDAQSQRFSKVATNALTSSERTDSVATSW